MARVTEGAQSGSPQSFLEVGAQGPIERQHWMERQSVGGAEMRQWVWGLPSLQKAVGKTGLYSGH